MLSFNKSFYLLEENPENAENAEIDVNAQISDEEISDDETGEMQEASAPSPAVPYIIGGAAGGVALTAVVLCIILFKKVSQLTMNLEQKRSDIDYSKQKIEKLENDFNDLLRLQNKSNENIRNLQQADDKLMEEINNVRLTATQSNDKDEKIEQLAKKIREQKEQLEYHDKILRQLQSAQQALHQNSEEIIRKVSMLSSEVMSLQKQSMQTPKIPSFGDDFSIPEPPLTGGMVLSYKGMLDLIEKQYNQAIFLSASTNMAGQLDFYEDTERKAYIVVIGENCYPNPYRFVNLERKQETYSHLSVLAPMFELRNIVNGNAKYGMTEMIPAQLEVRDDDSIAIRKKGVISFC